jgi:Glyoxalase/Bleomycin resistance protein/Dioxygenase superfamily
MALCTVDFESPVFVAMVCRLMETPLRGASRLCRSWIELRIANSPTRFVRFTPPGHENRIGTFFNGSLACGDVEGTYRQLRQRGVEFTSEPAKQPWGTYATFKDPDGNQFVLSST